MEMIGGGPSSRVGAPKSSGGRAGKTEKIESGYLCEQPGG